VDDGLTLFYWVGIVSRVCCASIGGGVMEYWGDGKRGKANTSSQGHEGFAD
jgi:hypothetical protein